MLETEKIKICESLQKKYNEEYSNFKWVTDNEAQEAETVRAEIVASLRDQLLSAYSNTKPYYMDLSPGCRHCGEGTWSCLFINGRCNGNCFFCPSEQDETGEPVTNTLLFTNPEDYLDYIEKLGIKGVSISGGEPLLTIDRSVKFLSAVTARFGDGIHKWLYTNGILITEEILGRLKDAGLNEIRFNLVAQGYKLDKIRIASGYIDIVTVEIPAIPEDYERLCTLLPQLVESGVKYLNLHQLRCTPYNFNKFRERGYTFLHGPDATVLESELTALNIIKSAADSGIKLPINYCSYVYRNNFQRIRARERVAPYMVKPFEEITSAGMIRTISAIIPKEEIDNIIAAIKEDHEPGKSFFYDPKSERFSFKGQILKYIPVNIPVTISYFDSTLNESTSYRNPFRDIKLNSRKKITAERWRTMPDIELTGDDKFLFLDRFIERSTTKTPQPASEKWAGIASMEEPQMGLQEYW
ncbi:MAG: radical SAM protein [Deltaproteobacteria bacterium]|nr:radical SAM protein [Deltaproteobacteria bacterium]